MFCCKCGKNTGSDFILCHECLAAEMAANAAAEPTNATEPQQLQEPVQNVEEPLYTQSYAYQPVVAANVVAPSRMQGFGKALTSAIMGFVGYIWAFVSLGFAASGYSSELIAGFILALMGLPFAIVGLVLGITSLKAAIAQKNQTKVTPIAPMILGIAGLSLAALTLLLLFIVYIIFMVNAY